HCFGCQQGGSVIDWVMKTEGVSFRHAVELLRDDNASLATAAMMMPAGPHSRTTRAGQGVKSTVPKLKSPLDLKVDDRELLRQVIDYYHETLKESPQALRYLEQRGLRSEDAIEKFKLGYANRTLGYRLPQKNRVAGAESRGRLQELGIFRASGHEHFSGCLVIPIFDEHGHVMEIYGRKIVRGLHRDLALHLYLPGPHKGVWNLEALQATKEIILCEALIDALTFWCAGYRNVIASYGVERFTDDHREAFRRHGTKRVSIAYDRDEAGGRAAGKLAGGRGEGGIGGDRGVVPEGVEP